MPRSGRSGEAHWWRRRYTFTQYLLRHWLRLVRARRLRWRRRVASPALVALGNWAVIVLALQRWWRKWLLRLACAVVRCARAIQP